MSILVAEGLRSRGARTMPADYGCSASPHAFSQGDLLRIAARRDSRSKCRRRRFLSISPIFARRGMSISAVVNGDGTRSNTQVILAGGARPRVRFLSSTTMSVRGFSRIIEIGLRVSDAHRRRLGRSRLMRVAGVTALASGSPVGGDREVLMKR